VAVTTTIRPNSTAAVNSTSIVGGTLTAHGVTSDNSDSSYIVATVLGNFTELDIASLTLAANERIEYIRYGARARSDVVGKPSSYVISFIEGLSGAESTREQIFADSAAFATDYAGFQETDPNDEGWTQASLDAVRVRIGGKTFNSADYTYPRISEIYVQVQVDTRPYITDVTAANLDRTRPTLTYKWNDDDTDPQVERQIKVFSSAQYTAGGFTPDGSAATWDSGQVAASMSAGSTSAAVTIGADLAAGGTYRAYVRGSRSFTDGSDWWSDWGFAQFTIVAFPPETPALTATADNLLSRVALAVQARMNALAAQDSSFEATGTGNWVNAANATLTRGTTDASHGTGSMQLTSVASGNMSARLSAAGRPVAAPGQIWSATADFRAGTTARSTRVDIEFYNSGGTIIGSATQGTAGSDATGAYTTRTVASATAPANTASVGAVLNVLSTGAAGESHRADRIQLAPGASSAWSLGGYVAGASHLVDYSDDGGTTWTEASWLQSDVTDAGQLDTLYDYSAPRGSARLYRARTQVTTPAEVTSAASSTQSVTLALPPIAAGDWFFKDLLDPSRNFSPLMASLAQSVTEKLDVFRPEGRGYPIVVAGDIGGYDGQVGVRTHGAAQWAQLSYFLRLQRPFLIQAPDGEQVYARISSDRSIERQPSPAGNVIRTISFPYVEVELS
jgi:hypothetical protein